MANLVVNCRFLTQRITGVQRYAIEISRRLKNIQPSTRFVTPRNILHKELARELGAEIIGKRTGYYWEQIELPAFMKKSSPGGLLINLANMAPIRYPNKIVTIHDVAPLRFPRSYSRRFSYTYKLMLPLITRTSQSIISDSHFSKEELTQLLAVPESRVRVIPAAVSSPFNSGRDNSVEVCEKPYILSVASLDPRKNFARLLEAFSLLKKGTIKLVIVGSENRVFSSESMKSLKRVKPNVIFTGPVEDNCLKALYDNAALFVYPSLYEGFGLPPLEAMACGCPCVVSSAASLPEVCGDAALYCDPYDVDDIASKISMVLSDDQLRRDLIHRGRERVKRFSWDKSAGAIMDVISEALTV